LKTSIRQATAYLQRTRRLNLYEQFTSFAAESYTIRLYGNDIAIMREEAEALCEILSDRKCSFCFFRRRRLGQEYKLVIDKEKANFMA
jgi:multidrug efflux pump subunit AcrB